jgi:chromate transport protein ChrA
MDESVIRGLVIGVVFAVIAFLASLVWKLIRSQSEVARRFKIVAVVCIGLFVLAMMYSAMGPGPTALWVLAGGAVIWIFRGRKPKA